MSTNTKHSNDNKICLGAHFVVLYICKGGVWILHHEISKFELYFLKFRGIWILHPNVLELEFYLLNFKSVWILFPKV